MQPYQSDMWWTWCPHCVSYLELRNSQEHLFLGGGKYLKSTDKNPNQTSIRKHVAHVDKNFKSSVEFRQLWIQKCHEFCLSPWLTSGCLCYFHNWAGFLHEAGRGHWQLLAYVVLLVSQWKSLLLSHRKNREDSVWIITHLWTNQCGQRMTPWLSNWKGFRRVLWRWVMGRK